MNAGLIHQLQHDMPDAALALRFYRRAHAAYEDNKLVEKMHEWYVKQEVTFASLVRHSIQYIIKTHTRRSTSTERAHHVVEAVTHGPTATNALTSKEIKLLMDSIDDFIGDMARAGRYTT
jgi:hypothetical protein